jgi:predicted dehydrogenase
MDKKRILIVGFGAMGCRHAQSFLDKKKDYEVHILEPSDKNIKKNIKRINAKKSDFIWYKDIDNIPLLDIAIVATSSSPRFEIVKQLIMMGYKKFLLEKIVFQSKDQFNIIIKMINESESIAYCNFVNRYFLAYNDIKKQLDQSNKQININVIGGALELGLGCNAIHYIDILQYLTNNDEIQLTKFNLQLLESDNRRGSMYKEFYGMIELATKGGDTIALNSELELQQDITISISQGEKTFLLNEGTGKLFISDKSASRITDFKIIPSSKLTHNIIEDIFKNKCKLTKLDQTLLSHTSLFKAFNNALNNNHTSDTLCPIT